MMMNEKSTRANAAHAGSFGLEMTFPGWNLNLRGE